MRERIRKASVSHQGLGHLALRPAIEWRNEGFPPGSLEGLRGWQGRLRGWQRQPSSLTTDSTERRGDAQIGGLYTRGPGEPYA